MRVKRSTPLIIAALLLTTVSTVAGFMVSPGGYLAPLASPPLIGATGGIIGSISIGNVCPLCRVPQTCSPAPLYYYLLGPTENRPRRVRDLDPGRNLHYNWNLLISAINGGRV